MSDPQKPASSAATDRAILQQLLSNETPISMAFETLIDYAVERNATDVFCTANREGFRLFMRCEGVLCELGQVERSWGEHFVNHANVLSGNPLTGHNHPVDGRIMIHAGEQPIDMRVSVMPTFFGDELAIRILDSRFHLVDPSELGMLPGQYEAVKRLIHKRSGLLLICGRTGSGKTTTLYSIIHELNDGTRKINTLEDPVECGIAGVVQSQVDSAHGQDFPELLRALLRHAPDVIMVGEIRDAETAKVAVQAATSGHLVFATVHAPSSAHAIFNITQLGVNQHVLAAAINGVISQETRRKPCSYCAERIALTDENALAEVRNVMGAEFEPQPVHSSGCNECDQRGYRGLSAIFEVLEISPEIRELIRTNESPTAVANLAIEQGIIPLNTSAKIAFSRGLATHPDLEA